MSKTATGAKLLFGIGPFVFLAFGQDFNSDVDAAYLAAKPADSVSALVQQVNSGAVKLVYEPRQGYLRSVLHQLDVSATSQILVFSKTSVQSAYISPVSPRAIYFNDRAYVGWIRGAPNIELAGIDPKVGPIFYTLANTSGRQPRFVRQTDDCLQCHSSGLTDRFPGLMARSVYAGPDGTPRLAGGSFLTTATSPMKDRWGGWYVTGSHGAQRHMGNEVARGDDEHPTIDIERGANVTDLSPYFDVDTYLTPHSDIVALMVAEQQMNIQNLITKAAFLTRKAVADTADLRKFGFTEEHVAAGLKDRLRYACEPLVLALTGANEPALTAPIKGTSSFASVFGRSAPSDKNGRRLSELNLETKLLRYPCSPMIYSAAFAALPSEAKAFVLQRLVEVLSGRDKTPPYAGLNPSECSVALAILRSTFPEIVNF